MVPRARRPTRPLANEPLHPCGAGREEDGLGGGGRRPGVGAGRARVALRARVGGALPPRAARRVGGPPRWGGERGGGGGPKGVGLAGRLLASPRHTRPSAPRRAFPPGATPAWPPAARPPPATTPRVSATVAVISRRVSLLSLSLSCPAFPRHVVPRGLGPRVPGVGWGAEPPPPRAFRLRRRSRPPVRDRPPKGGASGASRDGWRGVAVAVAVAAPRGAVCPTARPPARRLSAAGPGPVVSPRRSSVLRSGPSAPLAGRLCLSSEPGASPPPPSSVRPALSLALSPFPALPPPPCAHLPARPPLPVEASLKRPRWREGGPGRGCGVRGPRGRGGGLGFRRGEERREGPRPGASGRSPRPGFGDTVGASSGGGLAVGVFPCGGGPVARPGPAESRAGSAEARVLWAAAGGERVGRCRGRRRAWGAPPPPPRPRPPPPLQVPSASRRGGLKTHGGSPVRLGVGAVGPAGSREAPPFSPRLRSPPPQTRGRGAARRAPLVLPTAAAVGRGLPGGRGAGRGRVPRACAPRVPDGGGGRWEPPGRLWGVRARPVCGSVPGAPS